MSRFETLGSVAVATVPILAHIPHSATTIPSDVRVGIVLDDAALAGEVLVMTDHFTDALFGQVGEVGGVAFVNRLSRLVVDPERFRDDAEEVMARRGMGAVYCKTSRGAPLRDPLPSPEEREALLNRFFDPYHAAFVRLVDDMVALFGRCLILDGHSYPKDPLPFELRPDAGRPDVCLGTDPFHSPEGIVAALEAVCRSAGRSVARDVPFAGTIVPMNRYRSDARVSSVMVDLRRDTYMDESPGVPSDRYAATADLVKGLIRCASAWIRGEST